MSTYAQLSDVETALGLPVPTESAHLVQRLIDEAEILLAAYVGDLGERVDAMLTTAERVTAAVVGMVVHALRASMHVECWQSGYAMPDQDSTALGCLTVGRRERFLVGASAAAGSISLADADSALPAVFRAVRPRRYEARPWR